jgi:hypothetical protein
MGKFDQYMVKPNTKFSLKEIDSNDRSARGKSKDEDLVELAKLATEINALQDILYAQEKHKVLLVSARHGRQRKRRYSQTCF